MDKDTQEEIISLLAKCGRPDLIMEFRHLVEDPDYIEVSSESSEEYSSGEEEHMVILEDDQGFKSIE